MQLQQGSKLPISVHSPRQPLGPAALFAPTDRPEWFAKVADRADMAILDLGDGCRAENRKTAREAIASRDLDPARAIVHASPSGVEDYAVDIGTLRGTASRQVVLSKVSSTQQMDKLATVLGKRIQITTLIETPSGIMHIEELAQVDGVVALFWGTEDLAAGLTGVSSRFSKGEAAFAPGHIHTGSYRSVAVHTRSHVHLVAAAHDKASLDSIYANISDADGLAVEAVDATALRFAATACTHPGQIPTVRQAYRPSDGEIGWARRFLTEAEKSIGTFSSDGQMADAPLFCQAEAIARRAIVTGQSHGRQ